MTREQPKIDSFPHYRRVNGLNFSYLVYCTNLYFICILLELPLCYYCLKKITQSCLVALYMRETQFPCKFSQCFAISY